MPKKKKKKQVNKQKQHMCSSFSLSIHLSVYLYTTPFPLLRLERNTSEGNVSLYLNKYGFFLEGAVFFFAYVYIFQNLSSECELIS